LPPRRSRHPVFRIGIRTPLSIRVDKVSPLQLSNDTILPDSTPSQSRPVRPGPLNCCQPGVRPVKPGKTKAVVMSCFSPVIGSGFMVKPGKTKMPAREPAVLPPMVRASNTLARRFPAAQRKGRPGRPKRRRYDP